MMTSEEAREYLMVMLILLAISASAIALFGRF